MTCSTRSQELEVEERGRVITRGPTPSPAPTWQACKPTAFLCSNTSALDVDEIASVTSRPHLVMGTHFFSPANVMKLLENVRGSHTSEHTISSMMAWGKTIGKLPILVRPPASLPPNGPVWWPSGRVAGRRMASR